MLSQPNDIDLLAPAPASVPVDDPFNPQYYRSGSVECIDAIEAAGLGPAFCRGNAIKYIWRADKKDPVAELQDLKKAQWYLNREIARLEKK